MEYIRSIDKCADCGCFLCQAASAEPAQWPERLVLWTTDCSVVLMNRFPYANGHLMIAPRQHKAELEDLSDAEALDLQKQTAAAVRLLKRAVSAQGFNIGI